MAKTTAERFWSKVDRSGSCWIWTAYVGKDGYGRFSVGPRGSNAMARSHRFAYEAERGPIPDGLVLDHLCRNRACVRPDHLEPIADAANILRGIGVAALNARKTECKYGHEFTEENTRVNRKGHRSCLTCERRRWAETNRKRQQRKAA